MGPDWNKCQSSNIFGESGTNNTKCHRTVASGKEVAGAISSQVNTKVLHLEYARVLHEALLMPVPLYGSETIIM